MQNKYKFWMVGRVERKAAGKTKKNVPSPNHDINKNTDLIFGEGQGEVEMQNCKGSDVRLLTLLLFFLLTACTNKPLNNPYPDADESANIYYASFSEQPKTLDPARSYSVNEALFVAQIYEPPLQYHYLKRPYTLVPLTVAAMPTVTYLDATGKTLPTISALLEKEKLNIPSTGGVARSAGVGMNSARSLTHPAASGGTPPKRGSHFISATKTIAYSVYEIHIKPNIYYQPHPAFARMSDGKYFYHHLTKKNLADIYQLSDFKQTATRELTADDYVYEIKRLADPRVQSPIFGFLSSYIVGFNEFNSQLENIYSKQNQNYLDLRQYPLAGVTVVDKYTYRIKLKGYYPQFTYWLAMPFFAPVPWEADRFYSQPGMSDKNITLSWYPVGTGPYVLSENNPNRRMVLTRNPNFHGEKYPSETCEQNCKVGFAARVLQTSKMAGTSPNTNMGSFAHPTIANPSQDGINKNKVPSYGGDLGEGMRSELTGKSLPFIDKFIFTLEKETIPRWTKFLQGYYDQSAISSDSFDQAVTLDTNGQAIVTSELKSKGIYLQTNVALSNFYWGFNMLDPIVGGNSERARKLRQAIALAIDTEEFIAIFLNGRGIPAQSPLPPGIFGYQSGATGMDSYIYQWERNQAVRKNIAVAKKLLAEAGYPDGRDAKAGETLLLNYDVASGGTADDKTMFDWMRKQFAKIGIELQIRDTQYNRFQELVRTGQAQIYFWGWNADYPDPENFLFLLYGPNGKVIYGGENASNYANAEYDRLFEQMRDLPNGVERQAVINKMLAIVWRDTPWVWGFHPKSFLLAQNWVAPTKLNDVANNILKYAYIDPKQRTIKRMQWNQPVWWPLWVGLIAILMSFFPVIIYYWWQLHRKVR